jgi:WD40 repeat protein/serine/threonine protein kinase
MPANPHSSTAPEGPFGKVLAEILQAEEAGQPVDLSRAVRAHPEFEKPLREYFRNRDGFDRLAPQLAPTAPRAAAPPAPGDPAPGSRFGGYEIVRELGRGGMGVVYLARQRRADRLVALKLIRTDRLAHLTPRQRQEWLARFRTEGQAAARVTDERVVTVYVVGSLDGRPFYSMRYVEGHSLAETLKAGPLPNLKAAALMGQVARAVQAIHDHGVLHRDLKPPNILVDGRGRPYVTDFGLAKVQDAADGLTHTGDMLGSPHYMSPEQARGAAKVTEATDVYGLGATLYAVLTGRPPFEGTTVADTLHQVKYREPVPPRRLNPAVSRDLDTITLRCLEKEPARRFRSAAALADELRRYLEGRPILTRPVGPAGRLWRWGRRNPAFAALSTAAVVLLTLAGTLYWAYSSASRHGSAADQRADRERKDREFAQQRERQEQQRSLQEQERARALAYPKDMRRAQRHIDAGELAEARELLAKWDPKGGPGTDRRGWEWYYLEARCQEMALCVRGHTSPVQAVAWSPKGRRLASADRRGHVKVWKLAAGTNRPLFEVQANTGGGVAALAWSPDDKYLAAACRGVVKLWEVDSRKERYLKTAGNSLAVTEPHGHAGIVGFTGILADTGIASLTWAPRGDRLALVDANGRVQVWDLAGSPDGRLLGKHERGVHSAAWSPDGKWLASVGGDGLVTIWDPVTGKRRDLQATVPAGPFIGVDQTYALAWSADGRQVKVVCNDGSLHTLDASSGKPVSASQLLVYRDNLFWAGLPSPPGTGPGGRYIYGPGGTLLANIKPHSGGVTIWDAATGQKVVWLRSEGSPRPVLPPNLNGPEYPTGCVPAWDGDGGRLALGDEDGLIRVWHVGRGRRSVRNPVVNPYAGCLTWGADGRHMFCTTFITLDDLLAAHKKRRELDEARKRQLGPGAGKGGFPPGIGPLPLGPAFPVPAGQPAVAGMVDNPRQRIQRLDAVTGAVVGTWDASLKPDILAASPDRRWLACATNEGRLLLCRADGRGRAVPLEESRKGPAPAGGRTLLAWSADGQRLAFSTPRQPAIRLWDPGTRKVVRTLPEHGAPLRSLAWSSDGRRLAWAAENGTVKVWDVKRGEAIATFLYHVKQDRRSGGLMGGNTFASSVLAWGPGGKRLAVAGEDEEIKVWDVEDKAKEPVTLHGHAPAEVAGRMHNVVCTVAWAPRGNRLAAASPDGTFLIWDTATWQEVLTLRPGPAGPIGYNLVPSHAGALAWSPDGKQLAFFGVGGNVTIWDATPGR